MAEKRTLTLTVTEDAYGAISVATPELVRDPPIISTFCSQERERR
jgi:hypothetical protein